MARVSQGPSRRGGLERMAGKQLSAFLGLRVSMGASEQPFEVVFHDNIMLISIH